MEQVATRQPMNPARISCVPPAQHPFPATAQLLSGYKPEKKLEPARTADVRENASLKAMQKAFEKFSTFTQERASVRSNAYHLYLKSNLQNMLGVYKAALSLVQPLKYNEPDIQCFLMLMAASEPSESFFNSFGIFLSALVNNMKEDSITIDLTLFESYRARMDNNLVCMGFANCKNTTIIGAVGGGAGAYAQAGILTLKGFANRSSACFMQGGTVILEADFYTDIATGISGGKLMVRDFGSYEGGHYSSYGLHNLCEKATGGELRLYNRNVPLWKNDKQPYNDLISKCRQERLTGVEVYLNDKFVFRGKHYVEPPYEGSGISFGIY